MIKTKLFISVLLIFVLFIPSTAGTKKETKIPDYSMTERKDVPEEFKWRIQDIYASVELWKKDKSEALKMAEQIDKLALDWTSSSEKMVTLLEHLTKLYVKGIKLYQYASHNSNMDLANQEFQRMKGEMRNLFVQMNTKLSFMDPDILELGVEKFNLYLKEEPGLKPYKFGIEQVLRTKEHVLPTDQQKIVSLTGLFSGAVRQAANMLDDVEIPPAEVTLSDGKKIKLNYANYSRLRASANKEDRRLVMRTYWENHKKFQNTFAILLDGAMKQHFFNVRVRKYKDCLDARLFGEDIDPKVYHSLIDNVRKNLNPLHRYLILKKELLGVKEFLYEDIYASAVPKVTKKFSFKEAREIILTMMKPLGQDYLTGLRKAFDERWIDIYPNKGKQSGAYSGGVYGIHPYIKMNYNGSYDSLSTLAHELGHALHSYFSNKTQHFENARYPTFLAEIASTFNENILMNYLLKKEKDDLFKLYILDGYLAQLRGTIHRQTLFAEFELALHQHVEAGKTLTPAWLNKKYLELARYYYGHDKGIVKVGDFIQNEWSGIPHFYLNYYVFQYSTGIIASQALTDMVLKGKRTEREKYLSFLKAGGSRFPLDTLKLAGVDMTTSFPTQAAMKRFDRLVTEMEKIVKRLKKKKKL